MTQFSEIFYTSLISTLSGIFLAILAACYKSKCSDVSLCFGLIELKRNIEIEFKEDMRAVDSPRNTKIASFNNPPHENRPRENRTSLPADVP